ncbi:protein-disulfide reductase DsbD [Pelistega sp. NLN82]|uniref:Protein-disulfide reductase DsbD n=1 Tax=Pelistega ratti TaxID=2652177 RepID=A0A6L9Y8E7_9BURK|nr:protein-disulfide reductase DsbD [Pelistega ratti]NEN76004.1 protein-disulfide reductase DsbD [Pelistega ratti]
MRKNLFHFFLIFSLIIQGLLSPTLSHAAEDFLEPDRAFQLTASLTQDNQVDLQFTIAPGYYMYREQFTFTPIVANKADFSLLNPASIQYMQGEEKFDATFDKKMEVYHDATRVTIPLKLPPQMHTLEIVAQGCADAGLCYPPMYYYLPLSPTSQGYEIALPDAQQGVLLVSQDQITLDEEAVQTATGGTLPETSHQGITINTSDTQIANWLNQASLWHMLAIAFLLGLALSFTPCVLPMLPILLSLVVGSSQQERPSKAHSLKLTLFYVLGTSIVYTLLGIAAASIGAVLANWIQNPWVLSIFAICLVLFGIAMFGAYTIQMPAGIQSRLNNLANRIPAGQSVGALLMGMISSLICGPCVAAPLAGILLFISQTGDILTGGLILFVLAWGQGVSLIILGTGSGMLLPKVGMWMETVKKVCGLLLFAAALWMTAPLMPTWLPMILWAILALAFAYIIGTFKGYKPFPRFIPLLVKLIGWIATVWAISLLIGVSLGARSVLAPFNYQAQSTEHVQFTRIQSLEELQNFLKTTDKPVLLDFYADWCISCKEMENFTFTDKTVQDLMGQMHLLQADVTKNTPQDRELLKAFNLFGPPGIIFFDKNGQENSEVRVIGFQNAEKFAQQLRKALEK